MSRIKSLILLLSSLLALSACGYSFVLDGGGNLKEVSLRASLNQTFLRSAGLELDSALEDALSSMGLNSSADGIPTLTCTLAGATSHTITSEYIDTGDRYRLMVTVRAELKDPEGKLLWQSSFSDDGTYADGGSEEDALAEACQGVAEQIARQLAALKL